MFEEARGIIYPNITKPLYLQLKDILIDIMESGDLSPGDTLPAERTLGEMYDISRVTVRKCINELVREGYLVRSHGKKTAVAQRKVDHHLGRLVGSVEEFLSTEGSQATIRVIHKAFEEGSVSVRKHLKIDEMMSSQVYAFTRAIIQDRKPIAINYSFVPYDVGKIVESLDLTSAKVFVCLENSGYNLSYGEQEITSALCTKDIAGVLEYDAGLPVLVIRRTTYLDNGYPLLYEKTVYRGDKYQYSIRLQRKI